MRVRERMKGERQNERWERGEKWERGELKRMREGREESADGYQKACL